MCNTSFVWLRTGVKLPTTDSDSHTSSITASCAQVLLLHVTDIMEFT